jgi:biopolymer transport protein ExbD
MAMTAGGNQNRSLAEINVTPLIDVMLVLLIIFIITIPRQTHAIKIDNPTNHAPLLRIPEVIDLRIDLTARWHGTRQRRIA